MGQTLLSRSADRFQYAGIRILHTYVTVTSSGNIRYNNRNYAVVVPVADFGTKLAKATEPEWGAVRYE